MAAFCACACKLSWDGKKGEFRDWTTIRQMAIVIALLVFNDLGRSMTPNFLQETDFIYNYLHIVQKMNEESMW